MAIELEEIKQAAEKIPNVHVTIEQPVEDGWTKAADQIMHGDFSGMNVAILVILALVFLRPILAIATYVGAFFVILMLVKYLAFV